MRAPKNQQLCTNQTVISSQPLYGVFMLCHFHNGVKITVKYRLNVIESMSSLLTISSIPFLYNDHYCLPLLLNSALIGRDCILQEH